MPDGLPPLLVAHNCYRQPGGEEAAVQAEIALLHEGGAPVATLLPWSGDTASVAALRARPHRLVFNDVVFRQARRLIHATGARVVHCHNLYPLLTTAVYYAARAEGARVVQTVHNYRLGCLNGIHLRAGRACQRCRPGWLLPGVAFGCYRGSRVESAALALAQTFAHAAGAADLVRLWVAPSQFVRSRLLAWGLPHARVFVKPHHVPDPGTPVFPSLIAHLPFLYVGRLSPEKGAHLLLAAWQPGWPRLVLVGDGPEREALEAQARTRGLDNVAFLGWLSQQQVSRVMRGARCVVLPSLSFETFGLAVAEAYAHGVPVVASRLGAISEMVEDGVTGLLVTPGDAKGLAARLADVVADPARCAAMGRAARQRYEAHYSATAAAARLRELYALALGHEPPSQADVAGCAATAPPSSPVFSSPIPHRSLLSWEQA